MYFTRSYVAIDYRLLDYLDLMDMHEASNKQVADIHFDFSSYNYNS
jgi:hypothetical protein